MSNSLSAGTALVHGMRFDFEKVLSAYERLVDRFTAEFGGGKSTFGTTHPEFNKRLDWHSADRDIANQCWRRLAKLCDSVNEPLVHYIGPLTVKAFLLGKTWCVQQPDGSITTPNGDPITELANEPMFCLYGPEVAGERNSYCLADEKDISTAEALLVGDLADLGLVCRKTNVVREKGAAKQIAFVAFPHGSYGLGRGPIRVQCVGAAVPSSNLN